MENLVALKEAILAKKSTEQAVEHCYADILNKFEHGEIFLNLLELCEPTERTKEIFKVMDFVRFPVKRAIRKD